MVGKDNTLVLLAADTGKPIRRFREPPTSDAYYLIFSADAKALIARHGSPSRISRWDVGTGRLLGSAPCDMATPEVSWASADGRVLALGNVAYGADPGRIHATAPAPPLASRGPADCKPPTHRPIAAASSQGSSRGTTSGPAPGCRDRRRPL